MAISWNKKTKENKKKVAKQQKEDRKQERKANSAKGQGLESMMAYLDEDGNLTTVPPEEREKVKKEDKEQE
ncbi:MULTISPECIES: hypothetical protein [Chitinophaga]|uniref:hypothetical protein n=1 Tax=Chitinophaga TaxID=79328 RepID=UPI0009D4C3A9|nr:MULTISPECIES: hypothetical protein [Chitinophaga]OMP75804.1 hypothetical protein BW716_28260 [[Flexibacter] sp. ATCC 35208]WPQ63429.1 hypothetical protein SIO70_00945 [Chitinophaga sancti]WPV67869.1 hypothetical protein QQL36_03915 [Chitinophaga sp. LS1]